MGFYTFDEALCAKHRNVRSKEYEIYENIVGFKEDSTILAILLAISNIKAEFNYYLNGVMEQLI